jgi:hypothetical protein
MLMMLCSSFSDSNTRGVTQSIRFSLPTLLHETNAIDNAMKTSATSLPSPAVSSSPLPPSIKTEPWSSLSLPELAQVSHTLSLSLSPYCPPSNHRRRLSELTVEPPPPTPEARRARRSYTTRRTKLSPRRTPMPVCRSSRG